MKLFPALQGSLGTWKYYSTKMTARDLADQVKFASEVWENRALDVWIQRALNSSRAKNDIASYLAKQDDRFFNSIVVAALDGNPKFFPIKIADDPTFAILADDRMNSSFGVLRFDGNQKYYALDGQHRLMAIKALLDNDTEFAKPVGFENEEFSVMIVVQRAEESREDFMKKYRRLFSNLNRYAKPMDKATTIIMDEDDAFAICTRRLIQEHPFFSWIDEESRSTRVRCDKGENMSVNEPYFTNIITLYNMNIAFLFSSARRNGDEWGSGSAQNKIKEFISSRPAEETIDALYAELSMYWDVIIEVFPELRNEACNMRTDLSEDDDTPDHKKTNHLLFRPIGQQLFAELIRAVLDKEVDDPTNPTVEEVRAALVGLSRAEWRLHKAPWRHLLFVYGEVDGNDCWRMRSEDRKAAAIVGLQVMRWIVGVDSYDSEDSLESLKKRWRGKLIHVRSDLEIEDLWESIESLAEKFR